VPKFRDVPASTAFEETPSQQPEQLDRSFLIAGEIFTRRETIEPMTVDRWQRATSRETRPTQPEWIGLADDTIVSMLEPGEAEKWARLRASETRATEENPITIVDMEAVLTFLFRENGCEVTVDPPPPPAPLPDGASGRARFQAEMAQFAPAAIFGSVRVSPPPMAQRAPLSDLRPALPTVLLRACRARPREHRPHARRATRAGPGDDPPPEPELALRGRRAAA
jgi:hypothetical protein